MNELLQKHGCSNVFTVPEGLRELMADISREVLRAQPRKLLDFITKYLSALLITREHGIMAVQILDDLCDCRPTVSEHLLQLGFERERAETIAEIIKNEIEKKDEEKDEEKEKQESDEQEDAVREYKIIKSLLAKVPMDEDMSAKVCHVARNAYRDYWYRMNLLKKGMKSHEEEPWEIAARHTLELYKSTKPSLAQLNRATVRIQAAYKAYHIRRQVLRHLLPKKDKRVGREVNLTGPPLDVAASREIDLGPVLDIRNVVKEENVEELFEKEKSTNLGLKYDPTKTITHVYDDTFLQEQVEKATVHRESRHSEVEQRAGEGHADETVVIDESALMIAVEESKKLADKSFRISFSAVPPEIIDDEELPEVPEEANKDDEEGAEGTDDVQDIPEEICEDLYENTESYGVSPAPTSADETDVEDIEEISGPAEEQ